MLVGILHLGLQCLCNIEFGWLVSVGFIVLKDFYRSVLVTCRVRFQTDYLGMLFEKAIVACYFRSDAELLVRVNLTSFIDHTCVSPRIGVKDVYLPKKEGAGANGAYTINKGQ
ncbi:hypothetical protein QL285_080269 [Trifolium repens]|nr:hypothetical protein QL285_080269 [Trifolium repens]